MINRNSDRRTHARTYVRTYVPPYFFFRLGCGFCTPRMEDPRARAPQLMRTRMYGCWPRNIIAVIRWNWDSSALTRVLEASTWPLRFEPRLFIFRTFHSTGFLPFLALYQRVGYQKSNRKWSGFLSRFNLAWNYKYSIFLLPLLLLLFFFFFFPFFGDPVNSDVVTFCPFASLESQTVGQV